MFRNYLKTAWRNLLKNKFYTVINIGGLTIGLAIGMLILLWVQNELSFNAFHKQADNIYKVELFGGTGSSRQIWQATVAPIGPLAKQQLPEVKEQVRITGNYFYSLYKYHDKVFSDENVVFADPSFFNVFDFKLIAGNAARPFNSDNSVVITQATAIKYFGSDNAIGKVIVADNQENFTVSGVIDNFPQNSSLNYDMIMPMSHHVKKMLANKHDISNDFSNFGYDTFVLLKPDANLKSLCTALFNIHIKHKADDTDAEYLLLPLKKMHLYNADGTNRGIETVRIFVVIALLILVIACINYVNLSTARSMMRAKEISMRKIVGAGKSQLFMQFIVETALLFIIAAVLALLLMYMLLPVFNQISGKLLVLNLNNYHIWMVIFFTIAGTLLASSIYPALLLSSFEPLKALKGKISATIGDVLFRKILVVTQFVFSIILITGTIVITGQLKYIQSKELGYDKSQTMVFGMRDMDKHYDAVKAELLKQPGIRAITRASGNIVSIGGISGDNDWNGKGANQTLILHPMAIDKDFMPFFKMKLASGAGFTGAVADSTHLILNEAAITEAAIKDPIGKPFRFRTIKGTIIGVVKDFHFASMREKIAPAIFFFSPNDLRVIYIRTNGKNNQGAIKAADQLFKYYNKEATFNYFFLDDLFNRLYYGEQQEGTLFNYFAGIAIFISCLGLLGLAAFTAQVRNREIGVRKVLGASVAGIIGLLAQDFVKLIIIAIVIATPVGWYFMDEWLQNFAYRINIQWWVFALSGMASLMIAFLTIGFQSVKAALANPVKSLRSE